MRLRPTCNAHGLTIPALLLSWLVLACAPEPLAGPRGFSLDYATGSIPPPANYHYAIDVVFDDSGAEVDYLLEYRHREGMSEADLRELGYTPQDDIRWSGHVDEELADGWRELAANARLTGNGEPPPGADSLLVRISETQDRFRAGVPVDRAAWREIARQVDELARTDLDLERSQP